MLLSGTGTSREKVRLPSPCADAIRVTELEGMTVGAKKEVKLHFGNRIWRLGTRHLTRDLCPVDPGRVGFRRIVPVHRRAEGRGRGSG